MIQPMIIHQKISEKYQIYDQTDFFANFDQLLEVQKGQNNFS